MAVISHADTELSIDRALAALADMRDEFGSGPSLSRASRRVPGPQALRTEQVMSPRDAFYASTEMIELEESPGRIAAEFVTPHPPGIPLFVPGERINEELADYLKTGSAEGFYAEGCADQSLKDCTRGRVSRLDRLPERALRVRNRVVLWRSHPNRE